MENVKKWIKSKPILVSFIRVLKSLLEIRLNILNFVKFLKEYNIYKNRLSKSKNYNQILSIKYLYPLLLDRTAQIKLDPVYFYQDAWCAKKIFENKPSHHYDIASSIKLVSIISQFSPVTFVDIRDIDLKLENLNVVIADARNLPFQENSIDSLSSICVLEHIGLGRYGDEIDPYGTEKAVTEIKRVLKSRGNLYISLPVDKENIVYFNAHRAFTRDYILSLFKELKLIEEKYIYGKQIYDNYDPEKGFGTGLFYLKKL
jgi:SAM-dependent methyltransferase